MEDRDKKLMERMKELRENNFLKKMTELNTPKYSIEISGEFLISMYQHMEFVRYVCCVEKGSAAYPLINDVKTILEAAIPIKEV